MFFFCVQLDSRSSLLCNVCSAAEMLRLATLCVCCCGMEGRQLSSAGMQVDNVGCSVVVTTGGTGPAPRDVTPEATEAVRPRFHCPHPNNRNARAPALRTSGQRAVHRRKLPSPSHLAAFLILQTQLSV